MYFRVIDPLRSRPLNGPLVFPTAAIRVAARSLGAPLARPLLRRCQGELRLRSRVRLANHPLPVQVRPFLSQEPAVLRLATAPAQLSHPASGFHNLGIGIRIPTKIAPATADFQNLRSLLDLPTGSSTGAG